MDKASFKKSAFVTTDEKDGKKTFKAIVYFSNCRSYGIITAISKINPTAAINNAWKNYCRAMSM